MCDAPHVATFSSLMHYNHGISYSSMSWVFGKMNRMCNDMHGHSLIPESFASADKIRYNIKTNCPFDEDDFVAKPDISSDDIETMNSDG